MHYNLASFAPRKFLSPIIVGIGAAIALGLTVVAAVVAAPSIDNVTAQNVLTDRGTISWTTDVASDTQVEYGTTPAFGSTTPLVSTLVTNHSQTITGLQTNQLYYFRVKSRDTSGDLALSGTRTFITALGSSVIGSSTDSGNSNTMNTTRFTSLHGGKVASLSVYVGAVDASVANRNFQLAIYTANGSVPGTLVANSGSGVLTANAWNTVPVTATLAPNTSYFIAYNTNGTSGAVNNMRYASGGTSGWSTGGQTFGTWPTSFGATSAQSATFSLYASFVNDTIAPTVDVTAPTDGATVSGTVTVTANAVDDSAVSSVQFKRGDTNLGAADTAAPYTVDWDTSTLVNGSQTITAVATDSNGNSATSTPITVITSNAPKLTLAQPTAGQNITGTAVTIKYSEAGDWTPGDGRHAHFRLDGGTTKMDLDADNDQTYVITGVTSGTHTLEAVVADGSHVEQPGTGGSVTFTTTAPDTIAPTASVTSPAADATVQNTITVTADAADETDVLGVQFLLDGAALGAEDTTAPYSVSWDTTTVTNGNHTLTARARDTLNQTVSAPVVVNVQNTDPRATLGEWTPVMNWPLVPVHATYLYTGEILMWDAWTAPNTNAKLWNPTTNVWTDVPLSIPNSELFCAGQATGATGELVVMGGHSNSGTLGTKTIYTFSPVTRTWTKRPDMGSARWYPSVTQMADNRMVTFSGHSTYGVFSNTPEVFNPVTNAVNTLPFTTPQLAEVQYPQTTLIPSGKIMSVSAEHGPIMLYNPANSSWNQAGTTNRPYGVWTSYAPGKYLITGGGTTFNDYHDLADDPNAVPSRNAVSLLDMNSDTPVWSAGGNMNQGRSFHNVTMLPTGKALAIGGATIVSDFARAAQATQTAEQWDPATNTWAQMAAPAKPRMYHSVSLLLPDGRVLSAGGGRLAPATDQLNAQIYSPPYMFQGQRPTIASAPSTISHNTTANVDSPNAADVSKVTLVTLGSVTHATDWNQHFMELSFTRNGDTLTINTPANANLAPENYYMLFLVNSAGVPSEAKIVRLVGAPDTTAPTVTDIQSTNIGGTSATVSWVTNEPADTQVEYGLTTSYGSSTTLNTALLTTHSQTLNGLAPATTYHYRVKSRDAAGNLATSSDQTFVTAAADTQAPTASITAPANGATVSGSVNVTATASDNVGVAGVQFKLDGVNLGTEDTTSPYSTAWSTQSTSNGSHTLTAVARDAANNITTTAAVTVTVANTGGSGLVASYTFNEGSGTTVADGSGNGNVGSIVQASWYTTGKYGKALSFDGTNDYVSVNDANSLDLGTNRMTLEAWVRPTASSGWRTVMIKENGNQLAYGMYARENTNRPSGWIRTTASSSKSVTGTGAMALNTWSHLATTYDGSNLRLYVNGTLVRTQAATGTISNSGSPLKFGGNAMWGEYFAGQLDEIRIYNRALTQSEIQADMNTPL